MKKKRESGRGRDKKKEVERNKEKINFPNLKKFWKLSLMITFHEVQHTPSKINTGKAIHTKTHQNQKTKKQ